jgi:hypothetical protein
MARVYSKRFFELQAYSGSTAIDYVPAGTIWVVRQWSAYCNAPLLSSGWAYLSGGLTGGVMDAFNTDMDTTVVHQWSGRQVLNAGEYLQITADLSSDHWVTGYELTLP